MQSTERQETSYDPICLLHLTRLLCYSGASSQWTLSRQLLKANASVECQISHQRAKISSLAVLSSADEERK